MGNDFVSPPARFPESSGKPYISVASHFGYDKMFGYIKLENEQIYNGRLTCSRDDFTLFVDGYDENNDRLSISTMKLLDIISCKVKKGISKNPEIVISYNELVEWKGKPKTKEARRSQKAKVQKDLEFLSKVSIETSLNRKRRDQRLSTIFGRISLIQYYAVPKRERRFYIHLTDEYYDFLRNGTSAILIPKCVLSLDERNPNLYPIARKLAYHYGLKNNRASGNYMKLSVLNIIACSRIPSRERCPNNRERELIIKPFEHVLNTLVAKGILAQWKYCGEKHNPFNPAESLSADCFFNGYIVFMLAGHPSDSTIRQAYDK